MTGREEHLNGRALPPPPRVAGHPAPRVTGHPGSHRKGAAG